MKDKNKTKKQLIDELEHLRSQITNLRTRVNSLEDLLREEPAEAGYKASVKSKKLNTVKAPEQFRKIFEKAQDYVKQYFDNRQERPDQGIIEISGERYILVRAASMSTEFFDLVTSLYGDRGEEEARKVAKGFLYDIAHALGKADAKKFHAKMGVIDPIEKLSVGPVHFAYAGWAFVDIFPESNPSQDENCYIIYEHPFAFEADAWLQKGRKTEFPVCVMNAGYSSGWCEESFGIPLVSVEVECRARGDRYCRFVMATPKKIKQHLAAYAKNYSPVSAQSNLPDIPEFFQRKRLEDETIRENEQMLRTIVTAAKDAMISIGQDGLITLFNPAAEKMFGRKQREMLGQHLDCLMPEEYRRSHREYVKSYFATGKPSRAIGKIVELPGLRKNGEIFPMDISLSEGKIGKKRLIIAVARDITRRKKAESDLAAEKERLAVTLRSIGEGVVATDTSGKIILMNKVAAELTGWLIEDANGKHLDEVFHLRYKNSRRRKKNPIGRITKYGSSFAVDGQSILVAKNGVERIISASGAPISDKDSKVIGAVLVFRDITEKSILEREMLKSQKLESLGILAGGIAHDFNNILTSILGNVSLAKLSIEHDETVFQMLGEAEKAALQAKGLTQQLLTFSKGGAPIKETSSITDLLKDTIEFALRGSGIGCSYSVSPDLFSVKIDRGQISQVISNLVINAKQAMPSGGEIKINASNIFIPKQQSLPLKRGKYILIVIEDVGLGIPPAHLSKIFDPYFTTKQAGSGLGLAVTYSVIQKHGGHITVESEVGKGTKFSVYIPASEKIVPQKKIVENSEYYGTEKILVMDDEESVRKIIQGILEKLGYTVVIASEGKQAIELFDQAKKEGTPFDLVIMDLTIHGGMGGKETIKKIREFDPGIKALVASGYSTDPVLSDYLSYGFDGVLIKPFRLKELGEALQLVFKRDHDIRNGS